MKKICSKCGNFERHYKDTSRVNGFGSKCINCEREYKKTENGKQSVKRTKLKKFGISLEEFKGLMEKQNDSCAICKISVVEYGKNFAVDHNHQTGEVRGLLCHNCNLMLGHAKDNVDILEEAKGYLQEIE